MERPVALELDVAKAMHKSASVAGPAVVFNNNGTQFPLVGGVYNSRAKALIAYGCDEGTVVQHMLNGLAHRIPPVVIEDAPVHENVILADITSTCPHCRFRGTARRRGTVHHPGIV